MSKTKRWGLGLASGVLLGLALTPWSLGLLAWIAYVPLLKVLMTCGRRNVAVTAVGTHLVAYVIAGHWVVLHPFATTAVISATGLVILALLAAVPWALASAAGNVNSGWRLVAVIAGVGSIEMLHLYSEIGFPWLLLGHTQSSIEPFNQIAELGGVTGISVYLLGLNVGVFLGFSERGRRRLLAIVCSFVMVIVTAGYGSWVQIRYDQTKVDGDRHVLVVQTALGAEVWSDVESTERVDSLLARTLHVLHTIDRQEADSSSTMKPDLIVWPETAIPPTSLTDRDMETIVDRLQTPLLSGAIEMLSRSDRGPVFANSAFLYVPGAGKTSTYRKRRLVPFAEYVPYSSILPGLGVLSAPAGGVSGYQPGVRAGIFTVGSMQVGVLICLESTIGQLAREATVGGAEVLIVLTQDGWWGNTFGYRQHVDVARLRAIETRRPVLQASATGISAHIGADGRVRSSLKWMQPAAALWSVQTQTANTAYLILGDWPGWLCLIMAAVLILRSTLLHRHRR